MQIPWTQKSWFKTLPWAKVHKQGPKQNVGAAMNDLRSQQCKEWNELRLLWSRNGCINMRLTGPAVHRMARSSQSGISLLCCYIWFCNWRPVTVHCSDLYHPHLSLLWTSCLLFCPLSKEIVQSQEYSASSELCRVKSANAGSRSISIQYFHTIFVSHRGLW